MATILLIDDDIMFRRMISSALTRASHAVIEAGDGVDGLVQFNQSNPDLVICDIIMPVKGGAETMREIRMLSPAIPIIAISGGNFLGMADNLGGASVLAKPFLPSVLVLLVNESLRIGVGSGVSAGIDAESPGGSADQRRFGARRA